jgi:hypothetical protein
METDYSKLRRDDFEREIKKYMLYGLMLDIRSEIGEEEAYNEA